MLEHNEIASNEFLLLFQTFVFVAYNKVCTSQYFLWYLSLLPLVLPTLQLSKYDAITSLALWGFTQVVLPKVFAGRYSSLDGC